MEEKTAEHKKAIQLRRKGYSYSEILRIVPVAKSTLSLWLRDIGLARHQQQRLTEKRRLAQAKAQQACRTARMTRETATIKTAQSEISTLSQKELWLIGTALYWAEGSKQKSTNVSQRVSFGNSDPDMIVFFVTWLQKVCLWKSQDIAYSIYIHQSADIEKAKQFWSHLLKTPIERVYFKPSNQKTTRKNTQEQYHGLLRVEARRSTELNRKIRGWIAGIVDHSL